MALTKRARVDDDEEDPTSQTLTVASSGEGQRKNALIRTIKRTSGLEAPIVSLTGAHGVSPGRSAVPAAFGVEAIRSHMEGILAAAEKYRDHDAIPRWLSGSTLL